MSRFFPDGSDVSSPAGSGGSSDLKETVHFKDKHGRTPILVGGFLQVDGFSISSEQTRCTASVHLLLYALSKAVTCEMRQTQRIFYLSLCAPPWPVPLTSDNHT